jgi:hypothetical protein
MRSVVVVAIAEGFEQTAGLVEVRELVFIEVFMAEFPIEAFNERVLGELPETDEAAGFRLPQRSDLLLLVKVILFDGSVLFR